MSTAAVLPVIGYMPMPADFKYKSVFLHGKTQHGPEDPFRIRHPVMPCSRRAKLFSPFDALRGFDAAIWAKEILYEDRKQLDESEQEILNRKLAFLHKLTYNSRIEGAHTVDSSVCQGIPRKVASGAAKACDPLPKSGFWTEHHAHEMAKKNMPIVTVTYFSPCTDIHSFAYGKQGQYVRITGVIRKIDADVSQTITLDNQVICLSDISDISGTIFPDMDGSL